VRVVAGRSGGRRLQAPPGDDVRPTPDRVREAVFNALGSMDAIDGARVLDLLAGTGALGIEALSRGASAAVFVEHDRRVAEVVRANLIGTDLDELADVEVSSARRFLDRASGHFDLALIDPPYAFTGWEELLRLVPADLAVVESDRTIQPPEPWVVVRERRYGGTVVSIMRRNAATPYPGVTES
jgi:16S rRNA (guanine966-N2)-methyltransferase